MRLFTFCNVSVGLCMENCIVSNAVLYLNDTLRLNNIEYPHKFNKIVL